MRLARHKLGLIEDQRYEIADETIQVLTKDGRWPELNEETGNNVKPFPSLDSKTR